MVRRRVCAVSNHENERDRSKTLLRDGRDAASSG
jgi:hypothetical protein